LAPSAALSHVCVIILTRDLQVPELVDHPCEGEVEAPQAQDREDVAGEDEERVGGDGEDGGNRVHREDDVGELHHDEGQEQWSGEDGAGPGALHDAILLRGRAGLRGLSRGRSTRPDEEVLAMESFGDRQEAPRHPHHAVLVRIDLVCVEEEHLDSREDQEAAEDVDDPSEPRDELRTDGDHGSTHHQSSSDAPEQDSVLVDRGHSEEAEDHGDDEDVVHGQGLLDQVPREVSDRGRGAVVIDEPHAVDHRGAHGHHVGSEPEAEPVPLVSRIDEPREGHSQSHPEGRPTEGLPHGDDMRVTMEDAQVEGEEPEDENDEADVHPDHVNRLPGSTAVAAFPSSE
jgi:hypothetical protein